MRKIRKRRPDPTPAKVQKRGTRQTLSETATIKGDLTGTPAKPFIKYETYIKSKEWFAWRAFIFEWRGRKCQLCMGTKNLELHHMSYKNLGKENIRDVLIVCSVCHRYIHGEHGPIK